MPKKKIFTFLFFFILLNEFQSVYSAEWNRVYLATFPRSGNHWTRYLIEEASHIATSSVYCDPEPPKHMNKVFPWGGYCCKHGYEGDCRYPTQNDFVLVKTHYPAQEKKVSKFDRLPYQIIIRIVRHPVDSFYSAYVRNPNSFKENVPTEFVTRFIKKWRRFQTYWNKKKHVLTIRYEDILANPSVELKKICQALKYDVTDEDIARAVAKYPPEGYMLKHKDKFKSRDLQLINKELKKLMAQFNYPPL